MRSWGFILTACLLISGCGDVKDSSSTDRSSNSTADKKPVVMVTSQPLFEVADLLAGDHLEVHKITPDNIASRNWKPQKDDVKRLQNANMILISGAGYEPWKDRVSLPGSRLKDTATGYYSEFIRIPDAITHQHGPEGKHAQKITLVGDSPSYHYLPSELGLEVQSVHWDESQELTSIAKDELAALTDKLPKDKPRFILLNSLQPVSTATFATEAGFTVIRIDLCEYPLQDSSNSVFERLHGNLMRLKSALQTP